MALYAGINQLRESIAILVTASMMTAALKTKTLHPPVRTTLAQMSLTLTRKALNQAARKEGGGERQGRKRGGLVSRERGNTKE